MRSKTRRAQRCRAPTKEKESRRDGLKPALVQRKGRTHRPWGPPLACLVGQVLLGLGVLDVLVGATLGVP